MLEPRRQVDRATSDFEMSAQSRDFMQLGRRSLTVKPLAQQAISRSDSVLAPHVDTSGKGLGNEAYAGLIRIACYDQWWASTMWFAPKADGGFEVVNPAGVRGDKQFTEMVANFSLFFGLALQLYRATLVSDDSPFDSHMAGGGQLDISAQRGMELFFSGKTNCSNCHLGAEFSNASTRYIMGGKQPLRRMRMGDGQVAVYDEGFYNIVVTRTLNDISNGANERVAVNGAFKTPTLRNVSLTAPYFHNGDTKTLLQVVQLYNRGDNFLRQNVRDFDADIQPLGLSDQEWSDLVRFMETLTDDSVWRHAAPFAHPELLLTNGHRGSPDEGLVANSTGVQAALNARRLLPAVGAGGYSAEQQPEQFLGNLYSKRPVVQLAIDYGDRYGFWCAARVDGGGYSLVVQPCDKKSTRQHFQVVNALPGTATNRSATFYLQAVGTGEWVHRQPWPGYPGWHFAKGLMDAPSDKGSFRVEQLPTGRARLATGSNSCLMGGNKAPWGLMSGPCDYVCVLGPVPHGRPRENRATGGLGAAKATAPATRKHETVNSFRRVSS